jgi:predicted RNA-binding Zn ribbon-like protein
MRERTIEALPIDSTRLCCNFVNTVYSWRGEDNEDFFKNYDDFIAWCSKLGVAKENQLRALKAKAKREKKKASLALHRIRDLRLLLYHVISAIASQDKKEFEKVLKRINPALQASFAHYQLELIGNKFVPSFQSDPDSLISPVRKVLLSLNEMLVWDDVHRIKQCPGCGYVFYDETKNGKRRWCNPLACGTKDKMKRYTKKLKSRR